jgi:hypothetical protein
MNNVKYLNKKTGAIETVKINQKLVSMFVSRKDKHLTQGVSLHHANTKMLKAGFVRYGIRVAYPRRTTMQFRTKSHPLIAFYRSTRCAIRALI